MSASSKNAFRYLPVNVGDRTMGIPIASIKRVLKWSELEPAPPGNAESAELPAGENAVMVNLGELFTGRAQIGAHTHVVVVERLEQRVALVVDGVAPVKVVPADSYYIMPAIFSTELTLFGAVVRDLDRLALIIEPELLYQALDLNREG